MRQEDDDSLARTYQTLLQTLKLDAFDAFDDAGVDETIVPTDRGRSFADPNQVIGALPTMVTQASQGRLLDLEMKAMLGEGGMGQVRLAQQTALGREVAVKSLRPELMAKGSGPLRSLLQEAWLTGYLEHPNIIPIYTLGRDDRGSPLIVMKRIEGTPWADTLRDPERAAAATQGHVTQEWHLDVLIQVCRALEYAHSKGIVHRDLKPDNIMIGRFGEVYVLDWGIALSLREPLDGRLPMVHEAALLAGTPQYMAPEMTTGHGPIDERTDVYLLGAILHELLTGAPPHQGANVPAVLMRAFVSTPPKYSDAIPEELAQIATRAMAREPEERFPSVQAMRSALTRYLEHRGSLILTRQAQHSLQELERALDESPEGDAALAQQGSTLKAQADPQAEAQRQAQLAALFGACRFGFQQALAQWPDNEAARRGFWQVMLRMARHELEHGRLTAAQALLAELDQVPPELQGTLDALVQRSEQEQARRLQLERMARNMDSSVGQRGRALMALVLAIAWTALPAVTGALEDLGHTTLDYGGFVVGSVRVFIIALVVSFFFRRTLLATRLNRRIGLGVLGLTVMMMVSRLVIWLNAMPLQGTLAQEVVLYALFTFTLGLLVSIRISALSLIFVAGALLMSAAPRWDDYILALCNLSVLVGVGLLWRAKTPDPTPQESPR